MASHKHQEADFLHAFNEERRYEESHSDLQFAGQRFSLVPFCLLELWRTGLR